MFWKKPSTPSQEYAESIINTIREPLIALDQNLRVVSVGRSFYEVFKVNPEETVGQLIYDLGNKQWDIWRKIFWMSQDLKCLKPKMQSMES